MKRVIKTLIDENTRKKLEQLEQAETRLTETVKKLLLKNMSVDEIIEITGLTEQEIKDIQKALK